MPDPQLLALLNTLGTGALLLVTGWYAYLTHRLARSAEQQAWEAGRARVVVSLRTTQGTMLTLQIENIGMSAADDCSLKLQGNVHRIFTHPPEPLADLPAFRSSGWSLHPRQSIVYNLGQSFK